MICFSKYIVEGSLGAMSFGDASLVANVLGEISHKKTCS